MSTAREPSSWAPPPIAQHHGHQRTGNEWCDCAQNLKGNKTTWQIWWNCCCTHYRLVFSSQGNRNAWKPRENYSHTQIHLWQALEYVNPFRYKSETPTATRHAFAPTIWGHHQALFQTFVQLLQERKINEMQKSNCLKMRFELHIVKFLNKQGSQFRMAIKIWTPFFAPLLSRSQSAYHFQKSSRPLLTRMAHGICTSCPTHTIYAAKTLER